jgi:hypothetical protein
MNLNTEDEELMRALSDLRKNIPRDLKLRETFNLELHAKSSYCRMSHSQWVELYINSQFFFEYKYQLKEETKQFISKFSQQKSEK